VDVVTQKFLEFAGTPGQIALLLWLVREVRAIRRLNAELTIRMLWLEQRSGKPLPTGKGEY